MAGQPTTRGGPLYWLKRRSRRFWIAVIVLLPVLYVASFGPACWWLSGPLDHPSSIAPRAPLMYWPIGRLASDGPQPISGIIQRYALLGMPYVFLPVDSSGTSWLGLPTF